MIKSQVDISDRADIEQFVKTFYARLLQDEQLAGIFVDVAAIELDEHMPLICDYWEKLLLGASDYKRHTMNIHRALHGKRLLTAEDFARWIGHYEAAMDTLFSGPVAERGKRIAAQIAANMQASLGI